ncbi:hypothetical protein [Paenibacillus sp. y28]|uniref:hypothetical protein n=1 Tax=Paenibacillus sp. y28 TaxID=3129110 RepID=UPI0030190A87
MQVSRQTERVVRAVLKERGYIEIASNGVSMFPLIASGTICRFEPLPERGPRKGDIVLYMGDNGTFVGHRFHKQVRRNGEEWYVCKGDSVTYPDPLIRKEQFIGRMVTIHGKRYSVRTDSLWQRAWGSLLVSYPSLSVLIRCLVRVKLKAQGMRASL